MTDSRPDSVPGDRPRPQYGEYATPQEQAARIRTPLPAPPPVVQQAPVRATTLPGERSVPTPGRTLDRAAAVGLLVYGLFSVVSSIPAIFRPAPLLTAFGLDAASLGSFTMGGWGVAAAIILGLGWLATAWATYAAHRRGVLLFWIPLAGGFVFNLISGVLIMAALLSDPTVLDAVMRQAGA